MLYQVLAFPSCIAINSAVKRKVCDGSERLILKSQAADALEILRVN